MPRRMEIWLVWYKVEVSVSYLFFNLFTYCAKNEKSSRRLDIGLRTP